MAFYVSFYLSGWAIAKALADAGATIIVGTWPPVLKIFEKSLENGKFDEDSVLSDGSVMKIAKVYPLDAVFDGPEDVPDETKSNKRYAGLDGYTISEVAKKNNLKPEQMLKLLQMHYLRNPG